MLRSIIAVWTIALCLLVVAATSGCIGGNDCLNGDSCGVVVPQVDMARPASCATECASCAVDQTCVRPEPISELPAFCAHTCGDDRDCADGQKCVSLFASLVPSVCIGAGNPVGCGLASPGWHCDLTVASCKDADTLLQPYSDAVDRVCGTESVHCANGCLNNACK
jgi:hypothetical protein